MALAQVSIELIAIYFHSFENIQIGEMTFCKPDFIIIKSNYFQNNWFNCCVCEMSVKLVSSKSIVCNSFINFSRHSFIKHSLRSCLIKLVSKVPFIGKSCCITYYNVIKND
jgi:hypothetical protein